MSIRYLNIQQAFVGPDNYYPLSFKTPKEQEYIAKLVDNRNEVIQVWLRCF
jgi:hypothetical protein